MLEDALIGLPEEKFMFKGTYLTQLLLDTIYLHSRL